MPTSAAPPPDSLKYLERIVREAQQRMNAMPKPTTVAAPAAPPMPTAREVLTEASTVTYARPAQ